MSSKKARSPKPTSTSAPASPGHKLSSAATPSPPLGRLRQRVGFVGAGQMALALAKGFMASGLVAPDQVMACAPSDANLRMWRELGVLTTHDNGQVVDDCEIVFLAVKPNIFPTVVASLELSAIEAKVEQRETASAAEDPEDEKARTSSSKLFVSVMAGITLKTLTSSLAQCMRARDAKADIRVIRAHPNTPATVGCGCAVYSVGESECEPPLGTRLKYLHSLDATQEDGEIVKQLFSSVGIVEQVPEYQQDAFTGLAGSGPAYVYTMMEAMADGAVRMGLPRHLAVKFAAQTTLGAAKMSLTSGQHTGQLRDAVTSPGGTTARGLHALERGGLRAAMQDAVQASAERAVELGRQHD